MTEPDPITSPAVAPAQNLNNADSATSSLITTNPPVPTQPKATTQKGETFFLLYLHFQFFHLMINHYNLKITGKVAWSPYR